MATPRRKFTLEEKRRFLELYDELPVMSLRSAALRLGITTSLLWTLLHNRSLIARGMGCQSARAAEAGQGPGPVPVSVPRSTSRSGSVRLRGGRSPRLEAALWKWIDGARRSGATVTDLMIHRRAMDLAARMGIANFRASPAWYRSFKKREGVVRQRYGVYPEEHEQELDHTEPDRREADTGSGSADTGTGTVTGMGSGEEGESNPPCADQTREPTVLSAVVDGGMRTVTVPSLQQMKEAMKTLATGLLYRGFCDFTLLHRFEDEVAKVVKRAAAQGSQDSFVA